MYLFNQLKRIARQWLEGGYLKCSGGTYPAQLLYKEIADMAAERIKAAITQTLAGERPVKAILDAYNPTGSSSFVNFTTSKETRWQTDPRKCQINWVVCDSDWEAEFCRVADAHPKVWAYVKNQNLGLEVPYLMGGTPRKICPTSLCGSTTGATIRSTSSSRSRAIAARTPRKRPIRCAPIGFPA